jgi:hypothetical protein
MATGALVSVDEYLSTSYDPDCDYVDGVVEERNVGRYRVPDVCVTLGHPGEQIFTNPELFEA